MKILITGSTGLLGGRLTQFLDQNKSHQLLLGTRDLAKLPNQFAHLDAVAIDWTSQEQLNQICDSVDCIIHLAGMNAQQCARASVEELAADVMSTERLVNAAINNGVKRFIYLSTVHVYSNHLEGEINESHKVSNPHPYAANHFRKEEVISRLSKGKLNSIILRMSNAFGAPVVADTDCWMLLVNDLCKQVVLNKKIILKSKTDQRRDFIPIFDACKAIELLISKPIDSSFIFTHLYNLGGDWAPTINEIADLVSQRYEFIYKDKISFKKIDSPILPPDFHFNIEKIKRIGYCPSSKDVVNREIDKTIQFCFGSF